MPNVVSIANQLIERFGLTLTPTKNLQMVYQHDYGAAGYERYRNVQIQHNKRKIENVWADKPTLTVIAEYLRAHVPTITGGLCHGTRRGYEQAEFSTQLGCPVIGTEISDTAKDFPNTVQWDFHESKPEWTGHFSFVYSNSLDQAFDPQRALAAWTDQLRPDGLLFIEHSMSHSPTGAGEMDPFGAHPMVMPYLLFEWGRGKYRLVDILHPAQKKGGKFELWVFVIARATDSQAPL